MLSTLFSCTLWCHHIQAQAVEMAIHSGKTKEQLAFDQIVGGIAIVLQKAYNSLLKDQTFVSR